MSKYLSCLFGKSIPIFKCRAPSSLPHSLSIHSWFILSRFWTPKFYRPSVRRLIALKFQESLKPSMNISRSGAHSLLYWCIHTCAHDLFIQGLPCWKYYFMVFLKIKVKSCILIHPIDIYKIWGELFLKTLLYLHFQNKIERILQFEQHVKIFLPACR